MSREHNEPENDGRASKTLRIVEQLKEVRQKRDELRAANKGDDWLLWETPNTDPVAEECCAALDARELELLNELRSLDGKKPLERVTETGFLGLNSRTVFREVAEKGKTQQTATVDVK